MNIKGTLRVYELALKMKNLESFVHVSTCYVNCVISGWVEEKIFDIKEDPELLVQDLLKIPVQDVKKKNDDRNFLTTPITRI
jgi:alcohol-forming fatty acyl-CoA reductase